MNMGYELLTHALTHVVSVVKNMKKNKEENSDRSEEHVFKRNVLTVSVILLFARNTASLFWVK